ncbi:uncharacterized protein LOC135091377 [Scylla paramamosain]
MLGVIGQTGFLFILAQLTLLLADDRVTCCMGGWKTVRGVTLCSKPCCAGYEERQVRAPFLVSPVVCHKLTPQELLEREEARMTTTTPPPQPAAPPLLDQPRRFVRAASLYRAFLYRHRHMFLGLLREGFSRKELLAILERFLNEISAELDKPAVWYGN